MQSGVSLIEGGTEVIIAFQPNPKFTPKSTLAGWQQAVGPIVAQQRLPLLAVSLAFVGPLLRFAPPHLLNPQVELVGEREAGKSTLAALGASVWAGDPNSDVGGGETWDVTVNALDPQIVIPLLRLHKEFSVGRGYCFSQDNSRKLFRRQLQI